MGEELSSDLLLFGDLLNPYKIVLVIIAAGFLWLVNYVVSGLAKRLMEKIPGRRLLILQLATLFTFVWYFSGTFVIISDVLNPPKEVLLAAAGSMAVAMGIALKDVAASLVAGLLLLFDRPFRVGDRVKFGDVYGDITSIGLRSVRLQTLDDDQVTIPNSRFITETVASGNAGALEMMVVIDFHLALSADIGQVQNLVEEVIVTSRFVYLKKPVSFSAQEVMLANRLVLQLTARAYVFDVKYEKAFQTDIVTRVSALLQEQGIARAD